MKIILTTLTILVLAFTAFGQSQSLTNNDVLEMVKSNLAPEIVVAKIKNSPNNFDTSPGALKALKEAGVSEQIILAMVEAPSNNNNASSPSAPIDPNAKVTVYVYRHKEFQTRNMQPSIYVDDIEVARMDDGKYFVVTLDPGKHSILTNKGNSGAEIDMKPGETYYLRVSIKPGFWKGRGEMTYMQKEQGILEVKKMEPLEEKWIKDKTKVSTQAIK